MKGDPRRPLALAVLAPAMLALGACAARTPLPPPGTALAHRSPVATQQVAPRPAPARPAAAAPTRADRAALTAAQKHRLFRRFVEFQDQQAAW